MTKEASEIAKELEEILNRQVKNQNDKTRIEVRTRGIDQSPPVPIRAHQSVMQRSQYYTGDA
jgi:hypothetical protein